jgi:hypothetical protein
MIRALCALAGAAVLAAVAHVTIMSTGGYGDTNAVITLALVGAVIVGSYVIGRSSGVIAVCVVVALLCAEAFGFFATAKWHMTHSQQEGAPVREAMDRYRDAREWVERLRSDDRVTRAEQALREARTDAAKQSTAKDCLKGCIATLAQTVADASAAVANARASLQLEQTQARQALKDSPRPGAENALADRLGVEAWELDLIMAGLRSFACTVMAGALLAFAAHEKRKTMVENLHHSAPAALNPPQPPKLASTAPKLIPMRSARVEAEAFAKAKLRPGSGSLPLGQIRAAYLAWCAEQTPALEPLPDAQIAKALNSMFESVGLFRQGDAIVGLQLAS